MLNEKSVATALQVWGGGSHAVLLHGAPGIGLAPAAEHIVRHDKAVTVWVRPQKDDVVDYEKGTVTIAQIRGLYELLKTIDAHGRTVIIDAAEKMAEPAQNAFLKLLEEPPQKTRFILLTHKPGRLLATIQSRVQSVELLPVSMEQSTLLLDQLGVSDTTKRAQILFIAAGLPDYIRRLAEDDDYFERRVAIVRDARTFISGSLYERLNVAHGYKDSRENALTLLDDSLKQLRQTVGKTGDASVMDRMPRLVAAYDAIAQNGNVRVQLAATL